jgi:hypothetical protein
LYNYIKEKVYRQNLSMYLNFLHGAKSKAFTGVHPPHWVFAQRCCVMIKTLQDLPPFLSDQWTTTLTCLTTTWSKYAIKTWSKYVFLIDPLL